MKRAHILNAQGVVTNSIILADDSDPATFGAVIGPDNVGIGWACVGTKWTAPIEPEPTLADLRSAKLAAINAAADTLLAAGAPIAGGLHVALDVDSRADLTALAQTAASASSGAVSWPESYSRGWITIENVRIPLATAATGLTLAASVGDWYAAIVQHRRDLKDAAIAANDAAALDAIDITAGWPA